MRGMGTRLIRLNLLVFAPPIKMSKSAPDTIMSFFSAIGKIFQFAGLQVCSNVLNGLFMHAILSEILHLFELLAIYYTNTLRYATSSLLIVTQHKTRS